MDKLYWGEHKCQAIIKKTKKGCINNAYFSVGKELYCGVHARNQERKELPKNPNAADVKKSILAERDKKVEEKRNKNGPGQVILCKMRMMRDPEHIDGYLKVFPNFKHANRKDGFGCATLSPKSMGPIMHGQPGLPISKNLENFHQGNKVFPPELDGEKILPCFYSTQKEMYESDIPLRHKEVAKGKNRPVFSVWIDKAGKEHRISYFESRQFYCHFYERFAKTLPEFKKLKDLVQQGYNIQICGYDAYPIPSLEGKNIADILEQCYKDISRPFGHELVLYSLLVLKPSQYPWRKYKTFEF